MMSSLKMSKVVGIGGDRENSVELEKINKINVNYIHGRDPIILPLILRHRAVTLTLTSPNHLLAHSLTL